MDGRTGRTKRRRADVSFHRKPSLHRWLREDEDAAFRTGLGSVNVLWPRETRICRRSNTKNWRHSARNLYQRRFEVGGFFLSFFSLLFFSFQELIVGGLL